jgi:hypothetical protein
MMLSQAYKLLEPEAEKTAAAAPPPPVLGSSSGDGSPSDVAAAGLRRALKEATAEVEVSTKTAAQASPLDQLTKLAASVVEDEHAATMKEAQLYGAAVCDGFMARLSQYDEAAQKHAAALPPTKIASVVSAADDFEKFASDNPEIVREAHNLGYEQTKSDLNKLAEAAWLYGHNGTVQWIHKTASDAFVAGFADTARLIEAAR